MKNALIVLILLLLFAVWPYESMVLADSKLAIHKTPSVRIVSPQGGERVHGKITIKAIANEQTQIDYVDFYIQMPGSKDRYGWQDFTPPFYWGGNKQMFDTTLFDDGQASVVAFPSPMNDRVTNRVHFIIDNGKPTIKINKPKNNTEISQAGSIVLKINAADSKSIQKAPGIKAVHVYLDGGHLQTITKEPFEARLSTCLLTPGVHSIQAVAEDSEGLNNADTIKIYIHPKASCLLSDERLTK